MRSARDSPEPLSITISGVRRPRASSHVAIVRRARSSVAGVRFGSVEVCSITCRAITLLLNLLMSRTTSPRVRGEVHVASTGSEAFTPRSTTVRPLQLPPAACHAPRKNPWMN